MGCAKRPAENALRLGGTMLALVFVACAGGAAKGKNPASPRVAANTPIVGSYKLDKASFVRSVRRQVVAGKVSDGTLRQIKLAAAKGDVWLLLSRSGGARLLHTVDGPKGHELNMTRQPMHFTVRPKAERPFFEGNCQARSRELVTCSVTFRAGKGVPFEAQLKRARKVVDQRLPPSGLYRGLPSKADAALVKKQRKHYTEWMTKAGVPQQERRRVVDALVSEPALMLVHEREIVHLGPAIHVVDKVPRLARRQPLRVWRMTAGGSGFEIVSHHRLIKQTVKWKCTLEPRGFRCVTAEGWVARYRLREDER